MAQETQDKDASVDENAVAQRLAPGLHVVATPIGSSRDLSLRGRDALRLAEVLVCEDTRVLRKLLEMHGAPLASRQMLTYHEHNAESVRPKILAHLEAGRSVALTSDAGTPLIADPGYKLVRAAREAGHAVTALPGACAAVTALVLSGMPTDAFSFIGFPPVKSGARRRFFERWGATPGSLVIYESPRRLVDTLRDLAQTLGPEREAAIARELTKRFEEVRSGCLGSLADAFAAEATPKGEVVVVVGPPIAQAHDDETAIDALLKAQLQTESVKDAVRIVADKLGAPKKTVYARALAIKGTRLDSGET